MPTAADECDSPKGSRASSEGGGSVSTSPAQSTSTDAYFEFDTTAPDFTPPPPWEWYTTEQQQWTSPPLPMFPMDPMSLALGYHVNPMAYSPYVQPPHIVYVMSPPPPEPMHPFPSEDYSRELDRYSNSDSDICRDFKRGRCKRGRHCKYLHKKQSDGKELCKDALNGTCYRGKACKYIHITSDTLSSALRDVEVCRDWLNGRCFRPSCKFLHCGERQDSVEGGYYAPSYAMEAGSYAMEAGSYAMEAGSYAMEAGSYAPEGYYSPPVPFNPSPTLSWMGPQQLICG